MSLIIPLSNSIQNKYSIYESYSYIYHYQLPFNYSIMVTKQANMPLEHRNSGGKKSHAYCDWNCDLYFSFYLHANNVRLG